MAELILHHYDASPFSEKVRLLFGIRKLGWRSVIQPNIMPKPDLLPLTGGYRRIPVLQIGADIYCDTQVILAEVAAREGIDPGAGLGWAVNLWADRAFFQATVPIIFGEIEVASAFVEDRTKLSGRPFDVAAMKAASGTMKNVWRAEASWIDAALARSDYIAGDAPGMADIAAYMNVWFLARNVPGTAEALMRGLDRLAAWRVRMAAIGHGEWREMTPAEALEIARTSEPAPFAGHDREDPSGLQPGAAVAVAADDYGRDPIQGALVGLNAGRVVLKRDDPQLGELQVHFPRVGYLVSPR